MARQGLKPIFFGPLNVAAEAATHKDYLWDRFEERSIWADFPRIVRRFRGRNNEFVADENSAELAEIRRRPRGECGLVGFSIDDRRHIDFHQHPGMGKLIDVEECMRRPGRIAKRLGKAFEVDG